jgi:hypothetical protein
MTPATGITPENGDAGKVAGLLVLDAARRPYLLTTYRTPGGLDNPCILRWDPERGWVNTSEEKEGKDTALRLMEHLAIDPEGCGITHQFVWKLARKAWNRLEDVLYDRIRKN